MAFVNHCLFSCVTLLLCVILLMHVPLLHTAMTVKPCNNIKSAKNVSVATYNSRGFGDDRRIFLKDIMQEYEIIMLQEHWLYDSQLCKLQQINSDFMYHMVSGMDETKDIYGRPYGGCAILWNKSLCNHIKPLSTKSKRFAAVSVKLESCSLCIINVYMPCDKGTCNLDVFSDVLDDISMLLHDNNADMVIIGGDFNCDITRNSPQTQLLNTFMTSVNLLNANRNYDIDYTYLNNHTGSCSVIDHFYVSENIYDCISELNVIHRGDNLSDHEPLVLKVDIPLVRLSYKDKTYTGTKTDWKSINQSEKDNYAHLLNVKLDLLDLPDALCCNDLHCTIECHKNDINLYCNNIIDACVEVGKVVFPVKQSSYNKHEIPGWKEHVEPYKQKALLWHSIWKDSGRPRVGSVANIMCQTRAQYHYAIRRVKKEANLLKNEKLAENMCNKNIKEYWKEIKRIKGKGKSCSASIDNYSNDEDIANVFAEKYECLFNSVSYDKDTMNNLLSRINDTISGTPADTISCRITPNNVKTALKKLNHYKSDGSTGMMSDHLIYGGENLYKHLAHLMSAMLRHGVSADKLVYSIMIPIPKSGKNMSASDNYRAIALMSSIAKVLDIIIINTYSDLLTTSDLQFGFKDKSSTNSCSLMVKETIQYYLENNSCVNAAVLDASKAFDRINFTKLFDILLKRNIPPCVIRLIVNMYINQKMCVKWNSSTSNDFAVRNGVKQGGILSPILFCIYIDDLFYELKDSNFGCHVGNVFCGAFGYADDIILLCPSIFGLQKLINICDHFAVRHDVIFNADKK